MADALRQVSIRTTPQSEKSKPEQVKNNAGGYVFKLAPKMQLRRFLILGVDGGTYYQNSKELAADNAQVVINLAATQPRLVIDEIKEVALNNLAPKANPSLFALAVVSSPDINGNVATRAEALALLPKVARTATQLFIFINYAQQFRGWGPALREAVGGWYLNRTPEQAAYQILKYRQREGWTHRDVLRKSHPEGVGDFKPLFDYACGRRVEEFPDTLKQIQGFEAAKTAPERYLPELIKEYDLTWEMLPTGALSDKKVWHALVDNGMPYVALMRQLPRMTYLGVLDKEHLDTVVATLSDVRKINRSGVHPMSILMALKTYASGRSYRGGSSWAPKSAVVDALDAAFYAAFSNVEPTNKRQMLALDVSSSMMSPIANSNISAREASVAMAMITAAVEKDVSIYGFTATKGRWSPAISEINVSPRRRLDDNIRTVSLLPFSGTDCSLPMLYAIEHKLEVDQFVVYTDNETWAGSMHPHQALRKYREKSGIDAKMVVVGMTSTGFSIADPSDRGMLDVVGFDPSVPAVINEFAIGNV